MTTFVSYSTKDEIFVLRLVTDLRTRHAIEVWLDQWEIKPGDRIPEKIEQGLAEADVFVLVLSPDSVNSQWVEYERQAWLMMQIKEEKTAKQQARLPQRRLIPVLYRDCRKPAFIQAMHHVRISDEDYEAGLKQLADAILGAGGEPLPSQEISPPATALTGVLRRKYLLTLLKSILPAQFDEVVFMYDAPRHYLPSGVAQVQLAISLIEYGLQREGEDLVQLLDSIYTVAPHLRRGR